MASLTTIEGIGAKYAKQLKKVGIRGTVSLLNAGATKKGRKDLAKESGISEKLILEWCNRADLMRVKGVGEEYSDLLEHAGVDTVKELRTRKPANLHAKMLEVNSARKVGLVRRPPSLSEVEGWVENAKALDTATETGGASLVGLGSSGRSDISTSYRAMRGDLGRDPVLS